MAKNIWVIETGEYSDYRVVGVFSTKANAELVADKINGDQEYGDKATVSGWALDPGVAEINQGLKQYRVLMLRDGSVEMCERQPHFSWYEIKSRSWVWRRTQAQAYAGKGIPDVLEARVWAKTEKGAIKVANEQRTRTIAQGEWDK